MAEADLRAKERLTDIVSVGDPPLIMSTYIFNLFTRNVNNINYQGLQLQCGEKRILHF